MGEAGVALAAMVLVAAVREYVLRMLSEVQGLKALIVDKETLGIVSLVLSQSEILHKEVFLVEAVDATGSSPMPHLKAVCFLRPTGENIDHLRRHLGRPRFGEYHLFFSNILPNAFIHILADADENDAVHQVQELYADYYAADPFHFTLHTADNYLCYLPAPSDHVRASQEVFERSVAAVAGVFLSLKRRPVVRYQRNSDAANRLAREAVKLMYEREKPLFDFRRTEVSPLLLVIDRRDDPVTPLLNQWTYQAMVHELIGVEDNRVDLRNVPNIPEDQKEVVLSSQQDSFFEAHMHDNFGDVGASVAKLVDELQQKDRKNKALQTLEDMQQVLETYPEYRKQAGNVSKHVAIMTELQRAIDARQLMSVSQTEQELACSSNQAAAFEQVVGQLANERVAEVDRLRLVMLYALRYEKESARQVELLIAKLASRSSRLKPGLIYTLLRQCGLEKRIGDLYGNRDLFNMMARNVKRGLKGVENVYTQHQPLLSQTLESATKGRLRDIDYPFVGNHFQQGRPQEIVVFIIGGTTYEEAKTVALFNATSSTRVILGGTKILNSSSFLADLWEIHQLEAKAEIDGLPSP